MTPPRRRREPRRERPPPLLARPWHGFALSLKIHCGLLGVVLLVTALDTVLTPPLTRPPAIGWVVDLVFWRPPEAVWMAAISSPILFVRTPAILLLALFAGLTAALTGGNSRVRVFGAAFAAAAAISTLALLVRVPEEAGNAVEVARAFLCFAGLAAAPIVLLLPFRAPGQGPGPPRSYPSLVLWAVLVLNLGAFHLTPAGDLWRVLPAAEAGGRYSTMVAEAFRETLWIRVVSSVLLLLLPPLVVLRGRNFAGALTDLARGWARRPALMALATVAVLAGGLGLRIGWAVLEIAEMWGPRILLGVAIGVAAAWSGSFALLVAARASERLAPAPPTPEPDPTSTGPGPATRRRP